MSDARLVTDCSGPIARIQVYLAGLAWLEPGEGWNLAHPVLRPFVPEFEQYGWYALDHDDLLALENCLKGIYQQSVDHYMGLKAGHSKAQSLSN